MNGGVFGSFCLGEGGGGCVVAIFQIFCLLCVCVCELCTFSQNANKFEKFDRRRLNSN